MMRVFIACEIPGNIRRELVKLRKSIGDEHASIKWVEEGNIHLTMKFLGDVDDEKVEGVKERIVGIRIKPIEAHVSGLGVFPSERYMRVLWVGLEPSGDLGRLHRGMDQELSGIGFKSDKRFQAHVTLGRVRSVKDKEALRKKLADAGPEVAGICGRFTIDRFVLKKSTLTPQGPVYEDILTVSLA